MNKSALYRIVRMVVLPAAVLSADALFAAGDVLYWMIDANASVQTEGGMTATIGDFFSTYGTSGDSSFAARVRVTGGNITEDTFLDLYYSDGTIESGLFGVEFDDTGSGYWGAGVPAGNQSSVGDFSAGSPEYSFIVELGNVVWDESTQTASWTTVAASAATAYSSLDDFIHETFNLNPGATAVWTPTSFVAVPEPSSGLLVAIGFALIALRRKRRTEGT